MSSDPRDYYRTSSRNELPPLREILGDALECPPRSTYPRFDFHDVNRALPGSSKHDRYSHPSQHYPRERGPTLAPIPQFTPLEPSSQRGVSPAPHPVRDFLPREPSIQRGVSPAPHPVRRFSSREPSSQRGVSPAPQPERTTRRERSLESSDNSKGHPSSASAICPQPATGPTSYSYNVLRTQQGDLVDVRTPSSRAQGILRATAIIEDEDDSHKRYKCDWPDCDKKYDRPSSLEVHRHTHTGSQPYPCQYPGCNRAFNVKSNMLRHFRSHPPQKTRRSGKQKAEIANDNESDGEDDDEKWPETSSSRYFHKSSTTDFLPLSPQGSSSVNSPTSTKQFYSSSLRH